MSSPVQFDTDTQNAGLRIAIYSELDGRTTELLFSQFPIRIGRNRHNDLVLRHEYVSQWHAAIGFVMGQLNILQVGGSNSVRVDGRKLIANELLPISGAEEIRIVPFTLRCQPVSAPAPTYKATVMPLDEPVLPDLSPGGAPAPQHQEDWEQAPAPVQLPDPMAGVGNLGGGPMPGVGGAPAPAGNMEMQAEALALLDRLAQRYLGRGLSSAQEVAEVGARLEQTLDIFLRFFVALQRGQVQFYEQMGLPPPGEMLNQVEQCSSSAQLGGLTLSPGDTGGAWALEEAFESFKVHQVAVLRGLEAGVRSLLRRTSPKAVNKAAGRITRSPGFRTLWETYRQIHEDLAEEDQEVFKVVYGGQFRKAYLRLMQSGREAMRGQNR